MKKNRFCVVATMMIAIFVLAAMLISCSPLSLSLKFDVDGESYYEISLTSFSMGVMPQAPGKEGYTFDGWFWDKDVWQQPLTLSSIVSAPLSSDVRVYARWKTNTYTITFKETLHKSLRI